jgi:hypothetical protein
MVTRNFLMRLEGSPPCHRLDEHPATSPCPMPYRGLLHARWLDLILGRSPAGRPARAGRGNHNIDAHRSDAGVRWPKCLGRWDGPTVPGCGPKAGPAADFYIFHFLL